MKKEQQQTTDLVISMINEKKVKKSVILRWVGISAPTLEKRIKMQSEWKRSEILAVNELANEFNK